MYDTTTDSSIDTASNDKPPQRVVTIAFIPDGRSEPQEKNVYAEFGETLDMLVDRAIQGAWNAGDEPFMVIGPASGVVLWQSSRW
jgi:hypothetical protein